MTDRELMQQALEALEEIADEVFSAYDNKLGEVILALRERLAQPQRTHWEGCEEVHPECKKPRREWVGLTDDEIDDIYMGAGKHDLIRARQIEAKLREKNGGGV